MTSLPMAAAPYVLLFAAFSVAGWVTEVILKLIQYHRFINRGFLIGPYCPIYGWGALLITLLAGGVFFPKCTMPEAFLVGFFGCGALEYLVSYVMEKTSHARWWDYSNKPMNLNGRVWIGNLLLFGVSAVLIVYVADPFLFALFAKLSDTALLVAAGAFLVVIWTDRIISHLLMRVIRDCIDRQQADNTEEIRAQMREMLTNRSLLSRRIAQAYPQLAPRPGRLMALLESARSEYREATRRLKKQQIAIERAGLAARLSANEAMQARLAQAKALQKQALEKLRKVRRDILGMDD